MTNFASSKRSESERQPARDRFHEHSQRPISPLPADELESLLRAARDGAKQTAEFDRNEELGPGDVQYLRGNTMRPRKPEPEPELSVSWPDSSASPETLLNQAEAHLAQAISDSDTEVREANWGLPEIASNPVNLAQSSKPSQNLTLEDLGDLDLDITIELGRAELTIEDVLKLREGTIVSLDKIAGDPVDIVANGRLVARGELIVIQGKFGVRLSEVL